MGQWLRPCIVPPEDPRLVPRIQVRWPQLFSAIALGRSYTFSIWVLELMCTYSAPIYTHTYENNLYHPTLEFKSSLYLSNNLPGDAFFSPFYLPPTPRLNMLVHGPNLHSKAKSWQHVTSNFYIDHKLVNAILIFTIIYFSGQKSPS